jgi:hypothetical protein
MTMVTRKSPTRGPALCSTCPKLARSFELRGASGHPSTSANDCIFSRFVQNSGVAYAMLIHAQIICLSIFNAVLQQARFWLQGYFAVFAFPSCCSLCWPSCECELFGQFYCTFWINSHLMTANDTAPRPGMGAHSEPKCRVS